MERELKELTEILKAEKEVFVKYLEKLGDQQKALIENNLEDIRSSVQKINVLAQEAVMLENGRRAVIERLSKKIGVDADDVSIGKLLEKFKGPNFEELERLKNTILEIHQKVRTQKSRNELLIEQSMSVIHQTMNYINEMNNPKVTYANPVLTRRGASDRGAILSRTV
ncbi:MAG: flagellar protein FlgN [candidate division Zixibacteria bacterium]